ncbi:elongation factor P maturation arginine rhamnosyltransferase EarP [Shewanella algae]|uniref:elongation factor P maturation arginine rhamnosyltransferase EarP n=1 Tax=Shewanella algae TaxID=38313 RepID=UPI0031F5835B
MQADNLRHWDIFCTVVDNYGDIGVTWRLARQVAGEYGIKVRLWVDDLNSFAHILPELNPALVSQHFGGVEVIHWQSPLPRAWQPGEVLIEAFACDLPSEVLTSLPELAKVPKWINLDYLSAESWIDDCHGLSSPALKGVKKTFFFPGFTPKSGGLICEQSLFSERDAWQAKPEHAMAHLAKMGLSDIGTDDYLISLFSYETQALPALLELWQQSERRVQLLVPKGRSLGCIAPLLEQFNQDSGPKVDWQDPASWQAGQSFSRGALKVQILPMTDQDGYDRLLWSCDFNIVRGEDSFLRAQWAAKPFIWHIYQQEEQAHLVKLDAFMARYCDNLPPLVAQTWRALNTAFNCDQGAQASQSWLALNSAMPTLMQHAKKWPAEAINEADLANRLVLMAKNG